VPISIDHPIAGDTSLWSNLAIPITRPSGCCFNRNIGVTIDEPGKDGLASGIDDFCVSRNDGSFAERHYHAIAYHERGILANFARLANNASRREGEALRRRAA
jgi:hypothetical protein